MGETGEEREWNLRRHAETDPCLALVLATVHVEWTIRRACIALGQEPNAIIRKRLKKASGFLKLSREWQNIPGANPLEAILGDNNYLQLTRVFDLRNRLVHGNGGASPTHANELVEVALLNASLVRQYAAQRGFDLHRTLPVRQQATGKGTIIGHRLNDRRSLKQFHVAEDDGPQFYCDVDTLSTWSRLDPSPRYRVGLRIVFGYERRTDQNLPLNASFLRINEAA